MPRKTMGIQVKKGMYKDIESVIVVTDKLEATFLPSQGGKLTSLVLRETAQGRKIPQAGPGHLLHRGGMRRIRRHVPHHRPMGLS